MLWQIGCTLLNLFTGMPPFYFDTFETVKQRLVEKKPLFDYDRYECQGIPDTAR